MTLRADPDANFFFRRASYKAVPARAVHAAFLIVGVYILFHDKTSLRALVSQAQTLDQAAVSVEVLVLEIPEQSPAAADHFQKASAGVKIF